MAVDPIDNNIVTDHALIRWLERVHGIDMPFFRRELTDLVRDAAGSGARKMFLGGYAYVFETGRLVTVLTPEQMAKNRRGRAKHSPRDFRQFDEAAE